MVANFEQEEREDHYNDNSPEVDELRGEDRGVSIGEYSKVVALDVKEGKDDICTNEGSVR